MLKFIFALFLSFIAASGIYGQDTLPKISVIERHGKVIISWKNTYGANISNINIQRSNDSIKRFTTIGTVLNPMNVENGYVDTKLPGSRFFYRVFIAFEGGNYIFSKSYRPVIDTSKKEPEIIPVLIELRKTEQEEKKEIAEGKVTTRPIKPPVFVPSKFVFTGKDNNVIINLPDAENQKFSIKFFDESENPVFEIRHVKESYLTLEKVNFLHAGWFNYQLYNNEVLLEKFKFFIPKDSKTTNNGKDQRNK